MGAVPRDVHFAGAEVWPINACIRRLPSESILDSTSDPIAGGVGDTCSTGAVLFFRWDSSVGRSCAATSRSIKLAQ